MLGMCEVYVFLLSDDGLPSVEEACGMGCVSDRQVLDKCWTSVGQVIGSCTYITRLMIDPVWTSVVPGSFKKKARARKLLYSSSAYSN